MLITAPQAADKSTEHRAKTGMKSAGAESSPGLEVSIVEKTQELPFHTDLGLSHFLQTSHSLLTTAMVLTLGL